MTKTTTISFKLIFKTKCNSTFVGQNLFIVGNKKHLGSWQPNKAIPLHTNSNIFPNWESEIITIDDYDLNEGQIEYKYVIKTENIENIIWEYTNNRELDILLRNLDNDKTFEVNDEYFNNHHRKYLIEMNIKQNKILTVKSPFNKLKHNVLKYLFEFIDVETRYKIKFINRKFKKANPITIKENKVKVESIIQLRARANMNDTYLTLSLPNNFLRPLQLNVMVETKDQGWASVPDSNSWVELVIEKKDCGDGDCLDAHKVIITKNFKEYYYKKVELKYNFSERSILNDKIRESTLPNGSIKIVALSKYLGWLCYMRAAYIELRYLIIIQDNN